MYRTVWEVFKNRKQALAKPVCLHGHAVLWAPVHYYLYLSLQKPSIFLPLQVMV